MNLEEIQAKLEKLKGEDPAKYLEGITELHKIISDLNKELREAKKSL